MSVNEIVLKWYYKFVNTALNDDEALEFIQDCNMSEDIAEEAMFKMLKKFIREKKLNKGDAFIGRE